MINEYLAGSKEKIMFANEKMIAELENSAFDIFKDDKNRIVFYKPNKPFKNQSFNVLLSYMLNGKNHKKSTNHNDQTISMENCFSDVSLPGGDLNIFFGKMKLEEVTFKGAFKNFQENGSEKKMNYFKPVFIKLSFDVNGKNAGEEVSKSTNLELLFAVFENDISVNGEDLTIALNTFVGEVLFDQFNAEISYDGFEIINTSAVLFFKDTTSNYYDAEVNRVLGSYSISEVKSELYNWVKNDSEIFGIKMLKFEESKLSKEDFAIDEIVVELELEVFKNTSLSPEKCIFECLPIDGSYMRANYGLNILGGFSGEKTINYDLVLKRISGDEELFLSFKDKFTFNFSNEVGQSNITNLEICGGEAIELSTMNLRIGAEDIISTESNYDEIKFKDKKMFVSYTISENLKTMYYYKINTTTNLNVPLRGISVAWCYIARFSLLMTHKGKGYEIKLAIDKIVLDGEKYEPWIRIERPFFKYLGTNFCDDFKNTSIEEAYKAVDLEAVGSVSNTGDTFFNGIGFLWPSRSSSLKENDIYVVEGLDLTKFKSYCGNIYAEKQEYLFDFSKLRYEAKKILTVILSSKFTPITQTYINVALSLSLSGLGNVSSAMSGKRESEILAALDNFFSSKSEMEKIIYSMSDGEVFKLSESIMNSSIPASSAGTEVLYPGKNFSEKKIELDIKNEGVLSRSDISKKYKNFSTFSEVSVSAYDLNAEVDKYVIDHRIDTSGAEYFYLDTSKNRTSPTEARILNAMIKKMVPDTISGRYKYSGIKAANFRHILGDGMAAGCVRMCHKLDGSDNDMKIFSHNNAMKLSLYNVNAHVIYGKKEYNYSTFKTQNYKELRSMVGKNFEIRAEFELQSGGE